MRWLESRTKDPSGMEDTEHFPAKEGIALLFYVR